ncbi:DUF938 domain-containing protein [Candidatus Uabimicrobium sp. HlEnr_7]|uniref:DUF938 domain-containing protein n=1 Tax=Candidatus Uabimicrobium helgolandensis TaxID=3095367 RepID=UPI0035561253
MYKPFSEACERNKAPILEKITSIFCEKGHALEIGSGTGQHAVYFAKNMPHLQWQTSDVKSNHEAIYMWLDDANLKNILPPLELDVSNKVHWPHTQFNYIFTANTCHIMGWKDVINMFSLIGKIMLSKGNLCVYGPFKYNGEYTSESNKSFDLHLQSVHAQMGIRNFEDMQNLAHEQQLKLICDYKMPANNQLLHFQKV